MRWFCITIALVVTLVLRALAAQAGERRPTGAEIKRTIAQSDRLAALNNMQEAEDLLNPIFNNAWEMREAGIRLIKLYHAQGEFLKERAIWSVLKATYPKVPEFKRGYLESLLLTGDSKRLKIELDSAELRNLPQYADLRDSLPGNNEKQAEKEKSPPTQFTLPAQSHYEPTTVPSITHGEEKKAYFQTKISGTVELFGADYTNRDNRLPKNIYADVSLLPKFSLFAGEHFLFYLQGKLKLDSEQYAKGLSILPDRTGKTPMAEVREGYLEWNDAAIRMRVGTQIFDWSVTDTASVADNLNPRDLNDLIRLERIGVPTVDLRVGGDSFIQAAYVPWFTPSRVPSSHDRWSPPQQPGITAAEQNVPSLKNGQFALRTGTVLSGFDLGANTYFGYNFSPAGHLTPTSSTSAFLTPYYRKMDVYGLSAAKEIYGYNVRMESGYFRQQDGDKFLQYIGGVDREWGTVFKQTDSLYLLLQYVDETILSHGTEPLLFDFRQVFVKNIMAKLKYSLDDMRVWSFKVEGSYNLYDRDAFIEPAIVWNKSGISIETGIDIMVGRTGTFWGSYCDNNRFYFKVGYLF